MVSHNLKVQKLKKKIGSLEIGFCHIRSVVVVVPTGWSPHWTIRFLSFTNCENLEKIQTFRQKLFNLCPQTDTQTHILHPYRRGRDFFLYRNLYHFTSLRSFVCFTPFVKDTQKIRKKEARNGRLKKDINTMRTKSWIGHLKTKKTKGLRRNWSFKENLVH